MLDEGLQAERFEAAQLEYSKKIRTAAKNSHFKFPGYDVDDMYQELLVVLWESVTLYDPNKGATFNTFFWMRARQKIGMLDRKYNEMKCRKATVVSMDEESVATFIEELGAEDSAEVMALTRMEIQERWVKLTPQQRKKLA